MLTHMFRELLSYCVNSIETSKSYSLRITPCSTETKLYVNFWAGNSLHSMCIAVYPTRTNSPAVFIPPISGFLALLDKDVQLQFVTGFTRRFTCSLSRILPQHQRICSVPKFDAEDLESALLVPSVQILDRFDFRSVLDFLIMRLRSAIGSTWLTALPDFQKVTILCIFVPTWYFIVCSKFLNETFQFVSRATTNLMIPGVFMFLHQNFLGLLNLVIFVFLTIFVSICQFVCKCKAF